MIDISVWTEQFLQVITAVFGDRVWFVGLQGSYGRGEATESSDIDVVVILDKVTASDIQKYQKVLDELPYRTQICGFFSGKSEILHWEPSDLFQFYYDTKPILGTLDELLPRLDSAAVDRGIKIGVCNIYHGCVHNTLHEKREEALKELYKSAVFVVQAIYFKQTGNYVHRQKELLQIVDPSEQEIVRTFLDLKNGGKVCFREMSETLIAWSGKWIAVID